MGKNNKKKMKRSFMRKNRSSVRDNYEVYFSTVLL